MGGCKYQEVRFPGDYLAVTSGPCLNACCLCFQTSVNNKICSLKFLISIPPKQSLEIHSQREKWPFLLWSHSSICLCQLHPFPGPCCCRFNPGKSPLPAPRLCPPLASWLRPPLTAVSPGEPRFSMDFEHGAWLNPPRSMYFTFLWLGIADSSLPGVCFASLPDWWFIWLT